MPQSFLPPFERYRFELRLTRATTFPFEHGGVLRGLLSRALERHQLSAGVLPFACEAGHAQLEVGSPYAFTVTFLGEDRALAASLAAGLARWGREKARGARPTLGGNFVLERAELIDPPDLDGVLVAGAEYPDSY